MKNFMFKTKDDVIQHLRDVKRRKQEWQDKAISDYQKLMKETENERNRINAAIIN